MKDSVSYSEWRADEEDSFIPKSEVYVKISDRLTTTERSEIA
jgi:hypothetical protein